MSIKTTRTSLTESNSLVWCSNKKEIVIGYTGHEHLDIFKIINMNARLYDPVIGLFFSPDPVIQDFENTQCLNRYSYCRNNPVMNWDMDGKLMNPVFDTEGNFRGNTKEGYTGEIIIYDGSINFKMLTKDELLSNRGTSTYSNSYNELSSKAKSKTDKTTPYFQKYMELN